jgi:hypothetical protein
MHDHRTCDIAGEVKRLLDADAVIADGAVDAGFRGGEVGELAAETETERADLADALLQRAPALSPLR